MCVNTYRDVGTDNGMPDIHVGMNWWQRARELMPSNQEVDWHSQEAVDRLAPEQRLIYDKVVRHYDRREVKPLLLNIDGRAGTGKSYVIQVLSARLAALSGHHDIIMRCAPTGAASFGISGSTIHSLLKLPINKPIDILGPGPAASIQTKLARTRYLIIDEKSMISLKTLSHIDFRLQQAKGKTHDFGGVGILLFGDFWQLPPVNAKALYQIENTAISVRAILPPAILSQVVEDDLATEVPELGPVNAVSDSRFVTDDSRGIGLYQSFDQSIELTVQQRQDLSQVAFATALEGLRNSTVTRSDWETLTTRCQVRILLQPASVPCKRNPH